MKICSLYGVGFYYIPGTDMCIKVGGWVRAEYTWGANGNIGVGPWATGNLNNRTTNNDTWRARGYITVDARNQTEYGTVRGYLAVGVSGSDTNGAGNTFDANRAFIQWAGFTLGQAQSFYDFYSVPATSYWGTFPSSDTGDPGWKVLGYTAQFGNGFSATIAAEMRRMTQIQLGAASTTLATAFPGQYGGFQAPDIVGNLRVDQAWGSAQLMAAYHQVNATYDTVGITSHPDDKAGWAVGAGLKLNAPMIGHGDYLQTQVNYTEGALRYLFFSVNGNWSKVDGNSAAFGFLSDGVYSGTTGDSVDLTTAWNVNAAYEHFWNPRWRTSLYGGYAEVNYNDQANSVLCGFGGASVTNGCDFNWQTWWIGSRTQWNVTKDFYMGLDVLYTKLQSASAGIVGGVDTSLSRAGVLPKDDLDNWQFRFRVHRDFYP